MTEFENKTTPKADEQIAAAFACFQQGDVVGADTLLQSVLRDNPDQPDALYGLGIICFETERFAEAAICFGRLDAIQPGSKDLLLHLANAHALAGQPEDAANSYKSLLKIAPDTPDIHFNLGVMLFDLNRFAEAAEALGVAAEREPGSVEIHLKLGDALDREGQFAAAIEAWQRAISHGLNDIDIHLNIGKRLRILNRIDESITALEKTVRLSPDDTEVLFELQRSMTLNRDFAGAYEILQKIREIEPAYEHLEPASAAAALGAGDAAQALETCETHLSRQPRDCTMLSIKPFILNDLGQETECRQFADYNNLVHMVDITAPDGFDTLEAFNDALAEHILKHPSLRYSPPRATTVNGWQTGEILTEPKGPIAPLERIVRDAFATFQNSITTDGAHPYSGDWPKIKGATMWGVVLKSEGHQVPHLHPTGWISGVYYVEIPDIVLENNKNGEKTLGWLEFGAAPPQIPARQAPPIRLIEPKPGRLVLFPSYFFHRTIPYEADARRISIAFDFNPIE